MSKPGRPNGRPDGRATGKKPTPLAVSVQGLAKQYGEVHALEPLDLSVKSGERVSLIGHNGSGKTTLIKMLVGLLEPSEGTATIDGAPLGSIEARAAVSYLSDEPIFYDDLSVWEHLDYIARLHGRDDWEDHAAGLLDTLGLRQRADDLPATFSRGLRQKAAIAIAFVRPFSVMLVDEPFVGLDRLGRDALLGLFSDAHEAGATLVVATHELSIIGEQHRLIALANGIVTHDGSAEGVDVNALTEAIVVPDAADPGSH